MRAKAKGSNLNTRALLHSLWAFSLAELAGAVSQIVDGIVISRCLGDTGIAAFGLTSPCYYLVAVFSGILAMGGQAVVSRAMGAGDRKQVQKAVSTLLVCAAVVSIIMTVLVLAFPRFICVMFGAPRDNVRILNEAQKYILGWGMGIPATVFFSVLTPLAILGGKRKLLSLAVLAQAIVNCSGDILFVGVLRHGLFGAGVATSLDFYTAVLILLTSFYRKEGAIRLKINAFDFKEFLHVVKFGLPKLTKRLCKCVTPMFTNRMILSFGGSVAMAAISIQNNLIDFLMIIGVGIAESLCLVVQVLYSEKDWNGIQRTARTAIRALIIGVTGVSMAVFILAPIITSIYLPVDSPSHAATQTAIRILAGYVVLLSVNECIVCYVAAVREMKLCNVYTVCTQFVALIPAMFFLGKFFGTIGILLAYPAAELLSLSFYLIVALARYRRMKGNSSFEQALLLLPPTEDEIYSLETEICDLDGAIGLSKKTQEFCLSKGIDPKRSHYAALCTEEMVVNILQHGYPKSKNRYCAVRIIIDHSRLTLRYRDDCKYFNICERYKSMKDADIVSNIGIKMVYALSREVKYINILDLNTVILTF